MSGLYSIKLLDLVTALSNAADLISPAMADHHKRVAYITDTLAHELGISEKEREMAVIAASLHDIGAFSLKDRIDTLEFEMKQPHKHAELGYRLFRNFNTFADAATAIRFHHVYWQNGDGLVYNGLDVPMLSHLLHIADRIDILIDGKKNVLSHAKDIVAKIVSFSGEMFVPEYVAAFERIAEREFFWFDLASRNIDRILERRLTVSTLILDSIGLTSFAKVLSHVIDFKSPFTSTHTAGVAACANELASLVGMSEDDCERILIAGYLHDLGKLAVSAEILEKPARLDDNEFEAIKAHTYHTRRILESIGGFSDITLWASSHHEHLSGRGYPFHSDEFELDTGSRVLAVADVFVALTEDRPYRDGMPMDKVLQILNTMAEFQKLDSDIVAVLETHYEHLDTMRINVQAKTALEYESVIKDVE
jgi:HD-GYP domain-containing protein (c-di-GMP phosphodiesterase class II)